MPTLIPQDEGFIDQALIRIATDIDAEATPDEVWAVITDNERWPEWFPAAKDCRTTSERAEGVGATRWIHFDLFKVNERYITWDPPHTWAFTILDANLPGITSVVERFVVEPTTEGRIALSHVLAADLAPYMRPLAPLLRWRNGALFGQGLARIEGQVAKLRSQA